MAEVVTYNQQPALVFDFPVNWRAEVTKNFEYKTEVFTSGEGDEQRRALRGTPRKTIGFTVSRKDNSFRELSSVLAGWHRRLFLVPEPGRSVRLASDLPAAASRVLVDSVAGWVRPGAAVLLQHQGQSAYRAIDDVQGAELHFENIDGQNWPAGTIVRLLQPARIMGQTGLKAHTSRVAESVLEFSVEPTLDRYQAVRNPWPSFEGMEILYRKPNWASPLDFTYTTEQDVLDFDRGPRRVIQTEDFTRRGQRMNFLNRTNDAADEFEAFFHRIKGRRGTFLLPTWTRDIQPAQGLVAGYSAIILEGTRFAQMFADDPANRKFVVFTKDGRAIPNHIENVLVVTGGWGQSYGMSYGATADSSNRSVVLDLRYPWTEDISLDNIRGVSWLAACRLASDSLTFSYETDGVSQFPCSVIQVKDPPLGSRLRYGWGFQYGQFYGGVSA